MRKRLKCNTLTRLVNMIDAYLDEDTYEENTYECNQVVRDMDDLADYMQGVVNALYINGNIEELEHCLEEALHIVGIDMPTTKPFLKTKSDSMSWHLGYQRGVIDATRKT